MDFTFVSGDLSLDFVGTLRHRVRRPEEQLRTTGDLLRWAAAAGLVDAGQVRETGPPGEAAPTEARELRETIHRLATAARTGRPYAPDDVASLNRAAAGMPAGVRLRTGEEEATVERAGGPETILATVARAAVELLGGPAARRIRVCEGDGCSRLYVDTSRGRSRRWCDMRGCGNRAKAAGFRARHTHPAEGPAQGPTESPAETAETTAQPTRPAKPVAEPRDRRGQGPSGRS